MLEDMTYTDIEHIPGILILWTFGSIEKNFRFHRIALY